MTKPKILIIGGGIGGLSCATALAETGKFDISIYESDIIGGQASSKKSKLCNTEISWRVFGSYYHNISSIIKTLGCKDLFYKMEKNDACIKNNLSSPLTNNIMYSIIINNNFDQLNKILKIFFLSKDRAINEYHNITTNKFFNNNNFMNLIIGPLFGLEPTKTTLSGYYKFVFACMDINKNNIAGITKYPTNDTLFKPWKKYLQKKGVRIYENHALNNILTNENGNIESVVINNKIYKGDELIFACSLTPLVSIFNNNINLLRTNICKKINIIKSGQQFYISVNFYWKKNIIKDRKCHIYTFIDGWMPIILKRFINTDYVDEHCDKNIKEVWNIAPANYLLGNYIKKYTSQCSFDEIIYEIKMNIMNSEHFKNYFDLENNTWDDYFYDYEFDDRYYKKLPTTEKFSINKGIEENLLNNQETELGDNIYFSAYYVKNTVGGASMETSCEIGLTTADLICKKYNIHNPRKPIYKTRNYINWFTYPLVVLDCLLYKLKLNPLTDCINPIILLILYFLVIIVSIVYFLNKFKKVYGKNILKGLN